jgi:hypothetical protein
MKRGVMMVVLLLAATGLFARSVGGGISVFVPESAFRFAEGSLSVESSLETSLSMGDYIRFPLGVSYNQIFGLVPQGGDIKPDHPWLYADSLMPYLGVKARIPAGKMYFDLFGGGAVNWNPIVRPLTKNIEDDVADAVGATDGISFTESITAKAPFGYGWLAGGAIGVRIQDISVDINATYRHIYHKLEVSGNYEGLGTSPDGTYESKDGLRAMLRGLAIGVHGSFSF